MDDLRITAFHEAGHAVAALRLGLVFDHVTAIPDEDAETDGALHWADLQSAGDIELSIEADAIVLLAGPFAEARLLEASLDEVFGGDAAGEDREALATLGLDEEQFVAASRDALALIEDDWGLIERVAHELIRGGGKALPFARVEALATRQSAN
ncbi:MAG TPA: hypothetical protein VMF52_10470 [Steroidobacteraceae bacterium]|nr:hypothetical protein [Steroidobacteraceae bacterium]